MLAARIIENSILISLAKRLAKGQSAFADLLYRIYAESRIYRVIRGLFIRTKIYFKFSFLGKITDLERQQDIAVLQESAVIRWLVNLYKIVKQRISIYLTYSRTNSLYLSLKKSFYFFPVKTISTIVISAVITNTALSIFLKREIGLLSFFMRLLLLFAGLSGLNSQADWPTAKENSLVLRTLFKKNVRDLRKDKF